MYKRCRQWFSVMRAKNPSRVVFYFICMINLLILLAATAIILLVHLIRGNPIGFFAQMYHTVLVMINAGNINDVVDTTAAWDFHLAFSAILYLALVFVTMISFTGALIGYLTNKISAFVERSNAGAHPLYLRGHTVILNWNSRAAEIINDMLYKQKSETIVVLVQTGKEAVETEIRDRLDDTLRKDALRLRAQCAGTPLFKRWKALRTQRLGNRLTVIVRQGDLYAAERLNDVAIGQAKSVLILNREQYLQSDACDRFTQQARGQDDCGTVKLLIQVAEIAAGKDAYPDQRIVVEVQSDLSMNLVEHVIQQKQLPGKTNIIAVPINHILGDILAQIAVMPGLNLVYSDLFSYRGAEFFTRHTDETEEARFVQSYLPFHAHALALTVMQHGAAATGYYFAAEEEEIDRLCEDTPAPYTVSLAEEFRIERKSIVILGYNSKSRALIEGLAAFSAEWQRPGDPPVLDALVIDDEDELAQADRYRPYSFIRKPVHAKVHEKETICRAVYDLINGTENRVSILILSDDTAACDSTDQTVFAHLIYIQSVLAELSQAQPDFDRNRIDIVTEVCNPKNADIIANYNVRYVIVSNRYVSRLFNHLSEKEALYYFLTDILTFDNAAAPAPDSKEIYTKRAGDFFRELPGATNARQLIRAVYDASPAENKSVLIGYITADQGLVLFSGDQRAYDVRLRPDDYLVVFSNH